MPDASGRFRGISVPDLPWHKTPVCSLCEGTGCVASGFAVDSTHFYPEIVPCPACHPEES